MRRKGQDFAHTLLGYFYQGEPLTANHPFFKSVEKNGAMRAGTEHDERFDDYDGCYVDG